MIVQGREVTLGSLNFLVAQKGQCPWHKHRQKRPQTKRLSQGCNVAVCHPTKPKNGSKQRDNQGADAQALMGQPVANVRTNASQHVVVRFGISHLKRLLDESDVQGSCEQG